MRFFDAFFLLILSALPAQATPGAALERGAAITDPLALRELDRGRFGLGRILQPALSTDVPLLNGRLFASPSMAAVRKAIDEDFQRYRVRHSGFLPHETIGVGTDFAFQLFDRARFYSDDTRFMLAGIVNRMDRAYVAPETCGEIRLIYRLTRTGAAADGGVASSPRLPMTLNVVLKARDDQAGRGMRIGCAEIARRWLATAEWPQTGAELAARLESGEGPLQPIAPDNIDRIETNLQIAYAPKSATREFRTDYLLKVFRYSAPTQTFEEAPLENQIDRARIFADDKLGSDFKAWLLEPKHFSELDRGTILIPDRFLATGAVATTPVGFAASSLQPAFGLAGGESATATPVFSDDDVIAVLKQAAERGVELKNIRSVAGFKRRLNDITCAGCHQTRGIGGFHFPGVDWMTARPDNSTVVPGSPHFFGDQIRRRDILGAIRDGRSADYSRGFSSRPQLRGSAELAGTEYEDGWGAHCYLPPAGASNGDRSFGSWTCAEGLACQVAVQASHMGMCFVKSR